MSGFWSLETTCPCFIDGHIILLLVPFVQADIRNIPQCLELYKNKLLNDEFISWNGKYVIFFKKIPMFNVLFVFYSASVIIVTFSIEQLGKE